MSKFLIRFNKTRGMPGRGTSDHVWRVFEIDNDLKSTKEYLSKHIKINVPCQDEVSSDGKGHNDWNICCEGLIEFDKNTSTITINNNSQSFNIIEKEAA